MELVSTMEIAGEEREIADAYAREQIATNAQNIATNTERIAGLNNNLSQLEIDLKMLGYTVPKEMPVQNYVDSDGVFHQRVSRVAFSELSFSKYDAKNGNAFVASIETAKPVKDNIFIANIYTTKYAQDTSTSNAYSIKDKTCKYGGSYFGSIKLTVVDSTYNTVEEFLNENKGVYLYYELATEKTIAVGSEAVDVLKNDLSDCRKKSDITTNETLIGTFNGKNYYRRLFTGISGSGGSVIVNVGEKIEIYNYYGRAYVYGQSGASNAKYPIPNMNYYIESQNSSETSFQLTIPTSSDTRKVDLVIEYTKVDE